MLENVRRILCPVDGSELADRILVLVRRLLLVPGSELLLVRVVTDRPIRDGVVEEARRHTDGLVAALAREGVKARARVVAGEPAGAILDVAADEKPELIALTTHGRTGVERWVRGSVAERLLRASPFPVLLANPFAIRRADASSPVFKKLLVPLDGAPDAWAKVLPLAHDLARAYASEVVLFHVLEPVVELAVGDPLSTYRTEAPDEARASLERARATLGGVRARVELVSAPAPAPAILEAIEREAADLVVLATHGRSGVSRWAFGSVAEDVVRHCPAPVLVVRTGGAAER